MLNKLCPFHFSLVSFVCGDLGEFDITPPFFFWKKGLMHYDDCLLFRVVGFFSFQSLYLCLRILFLWSPWNFITDLNLCLATVLPCSPVCKKEITYCLFFSNSCVSLWFLHFESNCCSFKKEENSENWEMKRRR